MEDREFNTLADAALARIEALVRLSAASPTAPQPAAPALARTGENLGGLVPIAGGLLALGIVLRNRRKHSTP